MRLFLPGGSLELAGAMADESFAVLSAIILSGLPDYSADTSVLKKTIVVLFGPRRGTIIAMVCVVLSVIFSAILTVTGVLTASGIALLAITAPHALILLQSRTLRLQDRQRHAPGSRVYPMVWSCPAGRAFVEIDVSSIKDKVATQRYRTDEAAC